VIDPAPYEAAITRLWVADGAHDIGHLRRVWKSCREIALDEGGADMQVLCAAAYFHDAVNLAKDCPDRARASVLSANLAVAELRGMGFPEVKLAAVHHAIAAHSFSAQIAPETVEARILQDADRLEALGAVGIARMFAVTGQVGGGLFDPEDPMALRRPLDDRRFALANARNGWKVSARGCCPKSAHEKGRQDEPAAPTIPWDQITCPRAAPRNADCPRAAPEAK